VAPDCEAHLSVTYQNTADTDVIVDAVKALLEANQSIGLKRVWADDPSRVPVVPSAAVVAGTTTSGEGSPTGAGMSLNYYTNHRFTIFVMLFYAHIVENEQLQQETNRFAVQVRNVIHSNKTLNGLAYQGWVTQIEPGTARRGGAKFRASRLTVRYDAKTFI
jgi:hypothetical protein